MQFLFYYLKKLDSNFGLYGCNELLNLLLHNLRGSLDSSNVQTSCYKCSGWFQKIIILKLTLSSLHFAAFDNNVLSMNTRIF